MRFMMIVRHAEKQGPPPKQLMDAIEKLAEEEVKAGTMLGSGGLGPTALGARVRLSGGTGDRDRRTFHRGQGGCRRLRAV
jgi:hypothetical protein